MPFASGDSRFKNFHFQLVLNNKATKTVEAQALIPIVFGAK